MIDESCFDCSYRRSNEHPYFGNVKTNCRCQDEHLTIEKTVTDGQLIEKGREFATPIFETRLEGGHYWSTNGVQNLTSVIQTNAPGHVNTVPLANNPFLYLYSSALVRDADYPPTEGRIVELECPKTIHGF
jgi:hypothetical protein